MDGVWIDWLVYIGEVVGGEFCFLEDLVDGFDIKFFCEIEYGEIFVIEGFDFFCFFEFVFG